MMLMFVENHFATFIFFFFVQEGNVPNFPMVEPFYRNITRTNVHPVHICTTLAMYIYVRYVLHNHSHLTLLMTYGVTLSLEYLVKDILYILHACIMYVYNTGISLWYFSGLFLKLEIWIRLIDLLFFILNCNLDQECFQFQSVLANEGKEENSTEEKDDKQMDQQQNTYVLYF
jgi:hypothetical protein